MALNVAQSQPPTPTNTPQSQGMAANVTGTRQDSVVRGEQPPLPTNTPQSMGGPNNVTGPDKPPIRTSRLS